MSEQNPQHDLFEGQYYEKKARKTPLLGELSGQRYLPRIRIPTEYAIVIAIGVLVAVIISYAAGVEVGKRTAAKSVEDIAANVLEPSDIAAITLDMESVRQEPGEGILEESEITAGIPKPEAGTQKDVVQEKPGPVAVLESAFIIQIAAVKDQAPAEEAAAKLKAKGFDARVKKDGDWYRVYASGYDTIEQAKKARKEISVEYKDCYIKKMR